MGTLLQKIYSVLLLVGVIGFFVLLVVLGWNSGQAKQQALVVRQNAFAVKNGLNYFYNDYDRYPTATEYADGQTLVPYFSAFPPKDFKSKVCPETSWAYLRPTSQQFNLNFCLSAKTENFAKAWNVISENKQIQ